MTFRMMDLDAPSLQTGADPLWEEGRALDMDAFDQLPPEVRNFLNEHVAFYPIEDVLYEHRSVHRGDTELTLVWLLEGVDLRFALEANGWAQNRREMVSTDRARMHDA